MPSPQPHQEPDILVFDRTLIAQRKARMRDGCDFLQTLAQNRLDDRLQDINRVFTNQTNLAVDEEYERLPYTPQSHDLITSTLQLHTNNDLPGILSQAQRALKPDGVFIASMFGGETLHELRDSLTSAEIKIRDGISPRVHPFADKQQMGALLQRAGFALPVIDSEIITVTYDNMFKLMHDLRGMGETNIVSARDKRNPGKALFMEAARHYAAQHAEPDGRIRATFEIIFLLGWAPHESQQKPLKPGSASISLKDVL